MAEGRRQNRQCCCQGELAAGRAAAGVARQPRQLCQPQSLPCLSSRMLAGLRSRCRTLRQCRKTRPRATSSAICGREAHEGEGGGCAAVKPAAVRRPLARLRSCPQLPPAAPPPSHTTRLPAAAPPGDAPRHQVRAQRPALHQLSHDESEVGRQAGAQERDCGACMGEADGRRQASRGVREPGRRGGRQAGRQTAIPRLSPLADRYGGP